MKKLYEKSELAFAIVWIVIYSVLQSVANPLNEKIGVEYSASVVLCGLQAVVLFAFIWRNGLMKRYGLCRSDVPARRFLYATGWDLVQRQSDVVYAVNQGRLAFDTWSPGETEESGTYLFPATNEFGTNKTNIEYNYRYSDSYFLNSSRIYHHDLAKMSLNLALSAFNSAYAAEWDYNNKIASENVRSLLSDIGFYELDTSSYEGKPSTNTIGAALGQKELKEGEKSYTLIVVAIRGGGYEAEWGGNFTVGKSGNHAGFEIAADKVISKLEQYIIKNNISGNIKLWITGYSRAAATANLVAAKIVDKAGTSGTYTIDRSVGSAIGAPVGDSDGSTVVQLERDNIFAYTFETPQATTNQNSENYDNIFNIINPIDFVPKVAPADWGFTRYGVTYFIPSAETTSNYRNFILQVCKEYSKIVTGKSEGALPVKALSNQSAILDEFLNALTDTLPRSTYSPSYESLIIPIISEMSSGAPSTENILNAILTFCKRYPIKAISVVDALRKVVGNKVVWVLATEQGFEQIYKAIGLEGETAVDVIKTILDIIFQSHYPEITLAWMQTINGADGYSSEMYRKLYVNCPVDISVYDSMDQLVAQIIQYEAQIIDDSTIGAYIDGNGQKIIILPSDESYRIVLSATNNGTVTYTATEYNIETGSTEKVVSYYQIDVVNGDELTGIAENPEEVSSARYPLYLNDDVESLAPSITQSGDSVEQYSVTASFFGNGSVYGSGSYMNGEYAKVIATPDSGEEFLGWYVDGMLVSSDSEYRFLVDQSIEIVGKFTTNTHTMPDSQDTTQDNFMKNEVSRFVDVAPTAYYFDAVQWAVENGITTGVSSIVFGPDMSCTRAQMVTFLWRAAGCPVPTGRANPFTDVESGAYYYDAVLWAVENGITTGTSAATFSPDATVTRAQTVTFLWRSQKSPIASATNPFADVPTKAYYADAVLWAVDERITTGTTATTFSPDTDCTRAQIVTFLYRCLSGE